MHGKGNVETYITACKIDSQQGFSVQLRKLKVGLCVNLEGWHGERDGREVQKGGDMCMPKAEELHPVHPEGDHPWEFFGRKDAEAETPVLWPPHMKS